MKILRTYISPREVSMIRPFENNLSFEYTLKALADNRGYRENVYSPELGFNITRPWTSRLAGVFVYTVLMVLEDGTQYWWDATYNMDRYEYCSKFNQKMYEPPYFSREHLFEIEQVWEAAKIIFEHHQASERILIEQMNISNRRAEELIKKLKEIRVVGHTVNTRRRPILINTLDELNVI